MTTVYLFIVNLFFGNLSCIIKCDYFPCDIVLLHNEYLEKSKFIIFCFDSSYYSLKIKILISIL